MDARPRATSRRVTREPCWRCPDDDARRRLAKRISQDGLTVRAAEKAAQDGGARRRRTSQTVDPALAERARTARSG